MLKLQNANAKLVVFFLLALFSAQAQSKTYLNVKNCTDGDIDVKLYNGNDTAYWAAASKYEFLKPGQTVELYCHHTSCDAAFREVKNYHEYQIIDANTNLNIRVSSTSFTWGAYDLDKPCSELPSQHRVYLRGNFTGSGVGMIHRERTYSWWDVLYDGGPKFMKDDHEDIFDGRREDQVYLVGDFDNDGKDEVAWMQAGFVKWVVNGVDQVYVEQQDLPLRNIGTSLGSGNHMVRSDFIKSSNGKFRFRFNSLQSLVIEKRRKVLGKKIWQRVWYADTRESGATKLLLETSGNLKLIGDSTKWESRSRGSRPRLVMEYSGRLAIYSHGKVIWSVNN